MVMMMLAVLVSSCTVLSLLSHVRGKPDLLMLQGRRRNGWRLTNLLTPGCWSRDEWHSLLLNNVNVSAMVLHHLKEG